MDLWVWIAIFIAAWLLEALSSAAKNKRRQQQEQQQRERGPQGIPRAPVQARRVLPPAVPRRPPAQASRPIQPARTVSVPSIRSAPPLTLEGPVARPPRVREVEGTTAGEGVSAEVEVVEPPPESTDASHMRVTEKYRAPAAGEIGGPEPERAQARFSLRPRTAREAVVWMEILGPPKSERV